MKRITRRSLLFIVSVIVLCVTSCTMGSCFEETESYVKASFYKNTTKKLAAPDSITLYGMGRDTSLIYNKAANISTALIPLNSAAEVAIFIIKINDKTDTLEFHYTNYPHLISKECGYTYYHHLDTEPAHSNHSIIEIYTANSTITNENGENLRIFY
jgi:hypothetical protein